MASFGVVPEGFVAKDLETLIDEVEQEQRSEISSAINTQADSLLGQLNGIFLDKVAEVWSVGLAIYRARQADSADGEAFDNVAAITGATRLAAAPSKTTVHLNLDAATVIPLGSIVGIGATGAQWKTTAELTNGGAVQATLPVAAVSSESAPIVGNAYAIDTIVTPIGGWSSKAALTSFNSEPFALRDRQTLLVQVDGGSTQSVSLNTADFADIAAATAAEIVSAVEAATDGMSGLDAGGFVRLYSDTDDGGSSIKIVGGSACEALGFARELIKGFNPSRSAKIINANSEPYNLAGSPTLSVEVDSGAAQIVTFLATYFGEKAEGLITPIAASLLAVGVDTDTFVLNDGANPAVTFAFDDDGTVAVTDTNRAIAHTNTQTASQMRDIIIAAINAAPTLNMEATASVESPLIDLRHTTAGTVGNVAITENVADAGFLVAGMSGGVATAPATATAVQVARAINDQLADAVAYEVAGKVRIESLLAGKNSALELTGGTANDALGFTLSDVEVGTSGDAVLGRDVEKTEDFRIRRIQLIRRSGAGTLEAMRAALLDANTTPGVEQAFMFENVTDSVDAEGRPSRSFEAVVSGGEDEDIAATIFATKPAGMQSFKVAGADGVTVVVTDSQGKDHNVNFSRSADVDMYIVVDINVLSSEFGGGDQVAGEQQVRDKLKALGDLQVLGQDITILRYKSAPLAIAGVDDVTSIKVDSVSPPVNTANIVLDDREQAKFSTANISINVTFV